MYYINKSIWVLKIVKLFNEKNRKNIYYTFNFHSFWLQKSALKVVYNNYSIFACY
jgi:hypothetical protein